MWRERVEQNKKCTQRRQWDYFGVGKRVHENHHLRNRGVKGERLDVFGNFLDCRMSDLLLPLTRIDSLHRGGKLPIASLILIHQQAPNAREKSRDTFDPAHVPRFHLLERSHEHFVTTKGVRAVLLDYVIGIDDVAARLRHLLIVFAENDSLIDQTLERLWLRQIAEIEQHLVPEARIQKMQDRVLGPTDVQIDRVRLRLLWFVDEKDLGMSEKLWAAELFS